ncbi:DUF4334 domain-containing protein [Sphingomonas swuensis]|uniref:DUF4334 domain-containing protein n=1 Tax=Sphingomonas swuensis TaxID=977800 RepID=A0ABP7T146_9SPHN
MTFADRLEELGRAASLPAALALYDALPPLLPEELIGRWKGAEIATGHPFDGLLEPSGWWGKEFRSIDDVDPLLFEHRGRRFAGNPGLMPLGLVARFPRLARSAAGAALFRSLLPLLRTGRPHARLRPVSYRGVTSAAMLYDQLPIVDCFRRVDEDRLLGAMDIRGQAEPYLFTLRRA